MQLWWTCDLRLDEGCVPATCAETLGYCLWNFKGFHVQCITFSILKQEDRFIFSVSEFEVGQKKKQENGTKAKNVPGYREISVFY